MSVGVLEGEAVGVPVGVVEPDGVGVWVEVGLRAASSFIWRASGAVRVARVASAN